MPLSFLEHYHLVKRMPLFAIVMITCLLGSACGAAPAVPSAINPAYDHHFDPTVVKSPEGSRTPAFSSPGPI